MIPRTLTSAEPNLSAFAEPNLSTDWELQSYREGSATCRNYSILTMQVRSLAQQILFIGVAGMATALSMPENTLGIGPATIVLIGAIALLTVTASLSFVDWHYQSAFAAMRNYLALVEEKNGLSGPWLAHLKVRTGFKDHIASYVPFLLLILVGCLGLAFGLEGRPGSWMIPAAILFLAVCWFMHRCRRAAREDRDTMERLSAI